MQDGTLDTSFSRDGIQVTNFAEGPAGANGLAIQADGRILAAGGAGGRFAVARYRRHGRLDVSFGDDGKITTRFWSRPAFASGVVIQPNGKIVMAGVGGRLARSKFTLARYQPSGKLDPTFGREGRVVTPVRCGASHRVDIGKGIRREDRGCRSSRWSFCSRPLFPASGVTDKPVLPYSVEFSKAYPSATKG